MNALENRIPPPLVMILTAALMWGAALALPEAQIPDVWRYGIAGGLFIIAGLFGFPAVSAFGKAQTTINPVAIDQASTLVTRGPFRVTRNPMYVAMVFLLMAWAVYLSAPWTLLGPVAFILFITRFQIAPEERMLTAKFGAPYADYRNKVRRWL